MYIYIYICIYIYILLLLLSFYVHIPLVELDDQYSRMRASKAARIPDGRNQRILLPTEGQSISLSHVFRYALYWHAFRFT